MFDWKEGKVKKRKTHLFGRNEKWENGNKVGINLPLCPYYIKQGKYYLLSIKINKFTSYKN